MWHTGAGDEILITKMLTIVRDHVKQNGSVYVGTDSFISKDACTFATAICLHGADEQRGGKYFFRKVSFKREKFSDLVRRITQEVQESVMIAILVTEHVPEANIELHIDISPSHKQNKTSKFADMLTGFANGAGFDCKVKPDAWASQSVADKHSK